jgi:hypothetical protein
LGGQPSKESCSQRNLNPPNTPPRKGGDIMRDKDIGERSNVEQLFFGRVHNKLKKEAKTSTFQS